jgi:hypothetical protein
MLTMQSTFMSAADRRQAAVTFLPDSRARSEIGVPQTLPKMCANPSPRKLLADDAGLKMNPSCRNRRRRIFEFDAVTEASQLVEHSRPSLVGGVLADGGGRVPRNECLGAGPYMQSHC